MAAVRAVYRVLFRHRGAVHSYVDPRGNMLSVQCGKGNAELVDTSVCTGLGRGVNELCLGMRCMEGATPTLRYTVPTLLEIPTLLYPEHIIRFSNQLYIGARETEASNISDACEMGRGVGSRFFLLQIYHFLLFLDCVAVACLQYTTNCCLIKEIILQRFVDFKATSTEGTGDGGGGSLSGFEPPDEAVASFLFAGGVEDGGRNEFYQRGKDHQTRRDSDGLGQTRTSVHLGLYVAIWLVGSFLMLFPFVVKSRDNWLMLETRQAYSKGERVGAFFGAVALICIFVNACLADWEYVTNGEVTPATSQGSGHNFSLVGRGDERGSSIVDGEELLEVFTPLLSPSGKSATRTTTSVASVFLAGPARKTLATDHADDDKHHEQEDSTIAGTLWSSVQRLR